MSGGSRLRITVSPQRRRSEAVQKSPTFTGEHLTGKPPQPFPSSKLRTGVTYEICCG